MLPVPARTPLPSLPARRCHPCPPPSTPAHCSQSQPTSIHFCSAPLIPTHCLPSLPTAFHPCPAPFLIAHRLLSQPISLNPCPPLVLSVDYFFLSNASCSCPHAAAIPAHRLLPLPTVFYPCPLLSIPADQHPFLLSASNPHPRLSLQIALNHCILPTALCVCPPPYIPAQRHLPFPLLANPAHHRLLFPPTT